MYRFLKCTAASDSLAGSRRSAMLLWHGLLGGECLSLEIMSTRPRATRGSTAGARPPKQGVDVAFFQTTSLCRRRRCREAFVFGEGIAKLLSAAHEMGDDAALIALLVVVLAGRRSRCRNGAGDRSGRRACGRGR